MKKDVANEAFFWKHLADTLLDDAGVNSKKFYQLVRPVKKTWDAYEINDVPADLKKAARDRTEYIKENFKRIILELKR